jgi:hypothetical protein
MSNSPRPISRHRPVDHIHIPVMCRCRAAIQENVTDCTCRLGNPTMTLPIVTSGFCGSCDGFTGRIPSNLVEMEGVAQNILNRKSQPAIERGDFEERCRHLKMFWKMFLQNHSAEWLYHHKEATFSVQWQCLSQTALAFAYPNLCLAFRQAT